MRHSAKEYLGVRLGTGTNFCDSLAFLDCSRGNLLKLKQIHTLPLKLCLHDLPIISITRFSPSCSMTPFVVLTTVDGARYAFQFVLERYQTFGRLVQLVPAPT